MKWVRGCERSTCCVLIVQGWVWYIIPIHHPYILAGGITWYVGLELFERVALLVIAVAGGVED
jgi:hypothetical protein